MFRKDQFGIVFNTIFSLMFAIFLPLYIDGSNMFREAGVILWGPLVQQLTKDFIPGFAVAFAIGTYIDLKAMGDGFAGCAGSKMKTACCSTFCGWPPLRSSWPC